LQMVEQKCLCAMRSSGRRDFSLHAMQQARKYMHCLSVIWNRSIYQVNNRSQAHNLMRVPSVSMMLCWHTTALPCMGVCDTSRYLHLYNHNHPLPARRPCTARAYQLAAPRRRTRGSAMVCGAAQSTLRAKLGESVDATRAAGPEQLPRRQP
jgi:hypothetical protein